MKLSFSKLSSPCRRLSDLLSGWSRASRRSRRSQRQSPATRRLFLESLENRTVLSGAALGAGLPDLSSLQAPSIGYSALLGGTGVDNGLSIAVDSSGNAYVAGFTYSTNFTGTDQTNAGSADAFVSKLSPTGELLWSTLVGGSDRDYAYGIALDSSGGIYITGQTYSSDFPGVHGIDSSSRASASPSNPSAFVVKLNSDGNLVWSTLVGNFTSGQSIAAAASGDIYIAGEKSPYITFAGSNQIDPGSKGALVARLDSSGGLLWSTLVNEKGEESGHGIAVDSSGNAYVTGRADYDGSDTFFVSKLDSDGEQLWSTLGYPNGYLEGEGLGIAVDSSGNAYITSFNWVSEGDSDAYVAKLNADGELLWFTHVGTSHYIDQAYGIALGSSGGIYIAGLTASRAFPGSDQSNAGGFKAFVSNLSSDGDVLWSTLVGGSRFDAGYAIAVDALGNIYLAGNTMSLDFPNTTGNTTGDSLGESSDVFVVKLGGQEAPANPMPILAGLSQASIPAGSGQFMLTVYGCNFVPNSVVQWNGTALATTYVSDLQLSAVVPADNLAGEGMASITVVNPAPGGVVSKVQTFTVTPAAPAEMPCAPEAPASPAAVSEWDGLLGFYHFLSYQFLSKQGLDPLSSFNGGAVFAQYNVNLAKVRQASPLVSLILFNHFLDQGGDPYSSGILSTNFAGQGNSFAPAPGSPSERATVYYQNLGLSPDDLTDFYGYALGNGHPDDAIAALIAAQHGTQLV